jgi:hypothetical protein
MARYIFYAIAIYLLYRLIFDVVIPVRKTTKAMRSQFRQAQEQMNQAYQQQQQEKAQPQPEKPRQVGDYIDFEEVEKS